MLYRKLCIFQSTLVTNILTTLALIFVLEEDDDSGADSLNDQSLQSSLCGDSSGGGASNSNNIGNRNNSNTRGRNPRYRLQQQNSNNNHQSGYGTCSGNSRALVPYSTELVPVLTSNCNCNINLQQHQQQQGCLMQQHGNGLQPTSCGCFHLQCTATNNPLMQQNNQQLQTIPMNVERRLMQLEGDKDTLQMQVSYVINF